MVDLPPRVLDLSSLANGRKLVTPAFGAAIAEAATVCLESQDHSPGVKMTVEKIASPSVSETLPINWNDLDSRAPTTWGDAEVATEHGAYALSFLLVENLTAWEIGDRSRKGPGFDYWLEAKAPDGRPFQARLEVSGIRRGTKKEVEVRVSRKLRQIRKSDGYLPGLVVVVAFNEVETGKPYSQVVQR